MAKKRAFISFDYDHDLDLKNLLIGQAKNPDTPFDIVDMSGGATRILHTNAYGQG